MKAKLIHDDDGERTFAVVFDEGEEVLSGLKKFALKENLAGARLSAIGALSEVHLGFFDPQLNKYERSIVKDQVEVLSLLGNIAQQEGKPAVHAHIVVAKRDGTAHGGHLLEARVRPTLEVMVVESPEHLRRTTDERTGLALLSVR